jgi:hypothetical protein
MWRATPDVLRVLRQRYEDTDQLLTSIAAEFGLSERTLGRMRQIEGWRKRSDRLTELPKAVKLLAEAEALAAGILPDDAIRHPEVRAKRASKGDGRDELQDCGPHPSRLAAARLAPQDDGVKAAPPTPDPSPPLAGVVEGGGLTAIDRLEALVLKEIAAAEAARAQVTDKRQLAKVSDNSARTLATLTQTLRTLQQMRTGKLIPTEITRDDDDMPRDLDEFRLALARRIEAFVAAETDDENADEGSGHADVDAAE